MSKPFRWRPWNKSVYIIPHSYEYMTYRMNLQSSSISSIQIFDASMTDTYVKYAYDSKIIYYK